jgi:hypothetical protein
MLNTDEKTLSATAPPENPASGPSSAVTSEQTPQSILQRNVPADRPSPSHSLRNEIRIWSRDLLIAIGLALVIIVFLYQPVKVEGTSMAPLLSDQERIFINKFVYRFEPIERDDGGLLVSAGPFQILYQARHRFAW